MAAVACKKAEKLENVLACKKQASWRNILGAGVDAVGRSLAPTRAAYRWVKGITGWVCSPLVREQGLEEGNLDEPGDEEDEIEDWSNSAEALRILSNTQATGRISPASDQVAVEHEAAE